MKNPTLRSAQGRNVQGFVFALFTLIIAGLLVMVLLTTAVYRGIIASGYTMDAQRSALAAVVTSIQASDAAGGIGTMEGPEGQVLVLRDASDGVGSAYETRIYLYDGELVEEYAASTAPLDPAGAMVLAQTTCFSFDFPADGLIRMTTDQGTRYVALRSAQLAVGGDVDA